MCDTTDGRPSASSGGGVGAIVGFGATSGNRSLLLEDELDAPGVGYSVGAVDVEALSTPSLVAHADMLEISTRGNATITAWWTTFLV